MVVIFKFKLHYLSIVARGKHKQILVFSSCPDGGGNAPSGCNKPLVKHRNRNDEEIRSVLKGM